MFRISEKHEAGQCAVVSSAATDPVGVLKIKDDMVPISCTMVHQEEPGDVAHHRSEGKEVELGGTKAEDASPVHAGPVGTEPSEVERTSCRSNVLLLVPLTLGVEKVRLPVSELLNVVSKH